MKLFVEPVALDDLDRALVQGLRLFGQRQAKAYLEELLNAIEDLRLTHMLHRERTEFDPPIRVCRHKSHVILYRVEGETVTVLRVRHGREDWAGEAG